MRNAKWFVGLIFLIVAGLASGDAALRASDTHRNAVAQRKLERSAKTKHYQAQPQEFDRGYLRSRYVDGESARQSFDQSIVTTEPNLPQTIRTSGSLSAPPPSPGQDIGFTMYDYQAGGSQGYNVARTPGGTRIHFTWANFKVWGQGPYERYVSYSGYDDNADYPYMNAGTGYNGIEITGNSEYGGFTGLDVDSDNHAQVALHTIGTPSGVWHVQFPDGDDAYNRFPLSGYDGSCASGGGGVGGVLWPRLTADRSNLILHAIAHTNINDCPDHKLWYWRFDGVDTWSGPALIGNTPEISYVLAADAISDKVAVVTHETVGGYTQVAYIESQSDGTDWLTLVPNVDPIPAKTFITNYGLPSENTAWLHLTSTYDNSGALHVMWDEQENPNSEHIAIKHWNSARGTIRTVTLGYWDRPVSTSVFNLNLAKLSMGIGDGSTTCGGESNNNYVYCTYTQFGGNTAEELADYSSEYSYEGRNGGYMNGEIYLAISSTGGNTWSPPVNLTNTKTPGCNPGLADLGNYLPANPDSVCRSEHWATIGRVVKDVDLFFISDLDAGGIPQGEGSWQLNPVHYLRLSGSGIAPAGVCPLNAPVFEALLSSDPLCEFNAPRFGQDAATLKIMNLGNATLSGDVTVTDFVGAPTLSVTVTMAANGATEGVYSGMIEITHNDLSKPSPKQFPIDFFVFDVWFCPESNTPMATGVNGRFCMSLAVESTGRFASLEDEGGLWRYSDSSSSIYDGSLLVAHGPQGLDTTVFLRFYDRLSNGQNGFRSAGQMITDTAAYHTGDGCAHAVARMFTRDSVVGMTVDWVYPQSFALDEFIIARIKAYRHDPATPVTDLSLGMLVDLDVMPAQRNPIDTMQSGATNHALSDATRNLVYVRGVNRPGTTPSGSNTAERFRAGIAVSGAFEGAYVGNSVDLQLGGGPTDGFLYQTLQNVSGTEIYPSDTDLYALVSLGKGLSIAAGETLSYTVIFVSDTVSEASFLAKTDQALAVAQTLCPVCSCPCKFDPVCDGTMSDILDVVATVEVAFRSSSALVDPTCPSARSDVDGDGETTITDVVKVVNVAFRNQTVAANYVDPCQ